jgi:hypothetical protein
MAPRRPRYRIPGATTIRDYLCLEQFSYDCSCGAIFSSLIVRSSKRFDRQREEVADAALGLDCAWRTRIDLQFTPQPQDLDIDAPIEDIFMDSSGLQQMLAREGPLRCLKKASNRAYSPLLNDT